MSDHLWVSKPSRYVTSHLDYIPIHSQGPSEQRPTKMLEKRERRHNQELPNVLKYSPIISGTGKATDFKFGWYIHGVHPNKSPLKISEKSERGHI